MILQLAISVSLLVIKSDPSVLTEKGRGKIAISFIFSQLVNKRVCVVYEMGSTW